MIRARQTTAGILSQLDEVQLAETGVLELERNAASCDSDGGVNDIIVRPSPLISKNYPLLESPLLAEGPPPAEPEPSSCKISFFCIFTLHFINNTLLHEFFNEN